mgnify:CR=1 FL=1
MTMNKIFTFISIVLLFVSCKFLRLTNTDVKISRFKIGNSDGYDGVGFFNDSKKILYFANGELYPFLNNYTVLQNNENMTVIDSKGKELFKYKTLPIMEWSYSEGFFSSYWEHDWVDVYNARGKIINLRTARPVKNGFCVLYNSDNKMMYYTSPEGKCLKTKNGDIYYSEYCGDFSNGYAVVGENDLYGIINISAEEIVNKNFSFIGNLKYEYATASIKGTEEKYKHRTDPEYGLIDMHGNWIIEPDYYQVTAVSSESAVIKTTSNNKENCGWAVIHLKDKTVTYYEKTIDLQSDFESGEIFFDKSAIFCYSNNFDKFGIINDEGKIILNAICEKIEPFPDNGYWQVLINDKWMLFKEDEGILDPEKYLDFGKVK